MSTSDPIPKTPAPAGRQARRYRLAGIIVLLVGCAAAGGVYWAGTRGPDVSEDAAMTGFNRGEERQMEILYGQQGELIEKLTEDLKQPGTQAGLIAGVAGLVAAGCFYFGRWLPDEAKPTDNAGSDKG
jgi:hypothetical protein